MGVRVPSPARPHGRPYKKATIAFAIAYIPGPPPHISPTITVSVGSNSRTQRRIGIPIECCRTSISERALQKTRDRLIDHIHEWYREVRKASGMQYNTQHELFD